MFSLLAAVLLGLAESVVGQQTLPYSTGFELGEGYQPDLSLTGQRGWVGSAADGLVTNFFAGLGQQAYIGFAPPEGETNDFYSVFRPVQFVPSPGQNVATFSVTMQIVDSSSTNGPWDDFRWSAYNTNGNRLFSLDFDNSTFLISYVLDDGPNFVSTGVNFDNLGSYDLVISMDFARNRWTAILNDEVIVESKPITTIGSPLNLGDVDAVWAVRDPWNPGDNYMLFDNYSITIDETPPEQPRLEVLGIRSGGVYELRLHGQPGLVYRIEASQDFRSWETLFTFTAPEAGYLDFQDAAAPRFGHRFYRARQAQ